MSLRDALMKFVPVEQPQPMQMAQAAPNFAPVRDRSQLADALLARSARPAQNWGEAVNQIASAFAGRRIMDRQQDAEQKRNSALYSALMGEQDPQKQAAIMMQAGDPSLFNTITATRLERQLNPADPMDVEAKRVDLEAKKAQLDQLRNPQQKPPVMQTLYDDNGFEYKAQFNPQTGQWDRVGGSKAPPRGMTIEQLPDGTQRVVQGGGALTATDRKELFEADEGVQAGMGVIGSLNRALELNDNAYEGFLASSRGYGGSLVGDEGAIATQELENIVTTQALDQLKAIFGGMPTEGERKILLDVQGSVNQSKAVRKGIFERAIQAAERRMKFNRKKASAIRSGQYYSEGFDPTADIEAADPRKPVTRGGYTIQQVD